MTKSGILLSPISINRREPTPEQETEILDVVNEERRAYAALLLWLLGYPEQALARLHEALALAHELPHPYTLAATRCWAAYV